MSQYEDEIFSDSVTSDHPPISPESPHADRPWQDELLDAQQPSFLQRRTKPKKVRGYCINTTDEEEPLSSAESSTFSCPPSPKDHDRFLPPHLHFDDDESKPDPEDSQITIVRYDTSEDSWFSPRILPQYVDQMSIMSVQRSLSFFESVLDRFSPYRELTEATEDLEFERILARLLTEWYVVGGSLLAIAGLNAAVFGLGSDTLFVVDCLAKRAIVVGSIAAGLGIVIDAWFLITYSASSVTKFQNHAKDVYQTYFFFCLTCRLPALCMFLSSVALMTFLLAIAYEAWSAAVLVMAGLAGVVLTLQYLVFGIHRVVNMVIWCVRRVVRGIGVLFFGRRPPPSLATTGAVVCSTGGGAPVVVILNGSGGGSGQREEGMVRTRIEMPVPELAMDEADITICVEDDGKDIGEL